MGRGPIGFKSLCNPCLVAFVPKTFVDVYLFIRHPLGPLSAPILKILNKLLFFFLPVRSKSRLINYLTEKHENATSNEQEPSTKAINNSSG